jgi:hypothetical protein
METYALRWIGSINLIKLIRRNGENTAQATMNDMIKDTTKDVYAYPYEVGVRIPVTRISCPVEHLNSRISLILQWS